MKPVRARGRRAARRRAAALALAWGGTLTGCAGVQSALDPAGPNAREISVLWWSMAAAAAVILTLVVGLLLYAVFGHPERRGWLTPHRLIVFGGMVLPVVALSVLVPFNVRVAEGVTAERRPDTLTIHVHGRQWWWDIEYDSGTLSGRFSSANEMYLPAGEPVELILTTADVIHSLWFPNLGGKLDLIPGRRNRLMIEADRPGLYRGQCAEFCGVGHAKMALYAVVVSREQFDAWLERQRSAAAEPATARAREGARLFHATGCPLCHAVRGHGAWATTGPDLTHVGSRLTIGAGLLDNTPAALALWIARNSAVKPGSRMPDYADLPADTRDALAAYLTGLQ